MYALKQDRTASAKRTFDPTGTEATNVGYDGGHPCPPQTCSSPQNSTIPGPYTQGFDALSVLQSRQDAQLFQDTMSWLVTAGIFVDPSRPPDHDTLRANNLSYRISDFNNSVFSTLGSHLFGDATRSGPIVVKSEIVGYHHNMSFNFTGQTGQQDNKKVFPTEDYLTLLKRFKKSLKKECLDAIEAAAKEAGLKSMDEFFKQIKFFNMTSPGMLDQKGLFSDPNKTWNDVVKAEGLDEPQAAATQDTDNILIFEGYYQSWDGISYKSDGSKETRTYLPSSKGKVLFHEFLHTYFEQNHVNLLKTLDIPPPLVRYGKLDNAEAKRKKKNMASSDALNSWLQSCTTWIKSY